MKIKHSKFGLMREGFRQCQMMGICTLIVLLLGVILMSVSAYLDGSAYTDSASTITSLEIYQVNIALFLAIPMSFLMTLVLFRFLNNRAASDVYHALPHKRRTLYWSFAGSIVLWIFIWVIASTLVAMLLCSILPHIQLLTNTVLPYMLGILSMCLLVVAGTLVVLSITGTGFTNVLLSLVLLFLPRFCAVFFRTILSDELPFVLSTTKAGFFSNSSNLLFSLMASLFSMSSEFSFTDVLQPGARQIVYTLLLSLLYFFLADILFVHRRSEAAGQSAPTRLLQHVYRILIAMIPCVFISGILAMDLEEHTASSNWFPYFVVYLIAVLIYFAYELITTRKWKNLISTLPGLGIIVILNLGILLGMHLAYHQVLENRPVSDEIESVSIYTDEYYDDYSYYTFSEYADVSCHDIEITDSTAIALVSYYLDQNLSTWETSADAYYEEYYEYVYTDVTVAASGKTAYAAYCVDINTEHGTISRMIFFPLDEVETLTEILQNNEAYRQTWYELPDYIEGSLYLSDCADVLKQNDLEEIYDSYQAELQTCDFETLYTNLSDYSGESISLIYSCQIDGRTVTLDCPISSNITPQTLQLVYDKISAAQTDDVALLESYLAEDTANLYFSLSMDSYTYNIKQGNSLYRYNMDGYLDGSLSDEMELMQKFWQYVNTNGVLTIGEPKVSINFYDDTSAMNYYVLLPIDEAIFTDETICNSDLFYLYYYNDENGYLEVE